ncbi:hypothetical protein AB0H83_34980 [Dactylosporangium sp. NPDC050688]|uniref:hypothetical protein n=1 Tax=Dactylosporangium sp. NPDC050688 TaxID=3157217 RepID=UPI00340B8040
MTGRSWTRGFAPAGKQQYFKCSESDCPERVTYPGDNARNADWCPLHHKRMDDPVYKQ